MGAFYLLLKGLPRSGRKRVKLNEGAEHRTPSQNAAFRNRKSRKKRKEDVSAMLADVWEKFPKTGINNGRNEFHRCNAREIMARKQSASNDRHIIGNNRSVWPSVLLTDTASMVFHLEAKRHRTSVIGRSFISSLHTWPPFSSRETRFTSKTVGL